ncbi:MAG: pyridoxal-dependent decarboxylase [Solirubrobacterales bacterium]
MGPDVDLLIARNLHRNFIDHAEYPQTAEIEQRCIRMLADLFHAPGETMGARTQGSSEAIMLGALAMKWKWKARQEAAKKPTDKPNLIFGGDVHVVWEKFCRYFDVEPPGHPDDIVGINKLLLQVRDEKGHPTARRRRQRRLRLALRLPGLGVGLPP